MATKFQKNDIVVFDKEIYDDDYLKRYGKYPEFYNTWTLNEYVIVDNEPIEILVNGDTLNVIMASDGFKKVELLEKWFKAKQ